MFFIHIDSEAAECLQVNHDGDYRGYARGDARDQGTKGGFLCHKGTSIVKTADSLSAAEEALTCESRCSHEQGLRQPTTKIWILGGRKGATKIWILGGRKGA